MTHYRLLDADFLINLIRTFSLIEEYDDSVEGKIEHICNSRLNYSFVSTNYVHSEVNKKINSSFYDGHNLFFEAKKSKAQKIKKNLFESIRFVDMRKNDFMAVSETTKPKNLGEKSLVALLSSKYSQQINSGRESAQIVSNNQKDVTSYFNRIKKLYPQMADVNASSLIVSNYDFYYSLFDQLGFDKSFRFYYYFVSNIDARVCDKSKINGLIYKEVRSRA